MLLETLIITATPFVISAITGLVKKLPTFAELRVSRKPVIRLLAAVVSFVYVAVGLWIAPGEVSADMLTTAFTTMVLAFVAWLSSLGSYHAFFNKK